MNRERGIIERRGREMLFNVYEYFVAEKESCKELLVTLNLLLRNAQGCHADHVVVSTKCLEQVVSHYRNISRVTERVSAATHINKNTVTRISKEGKDAKINNTNIEVPVKKPRGKKNFFGSEGLLEFRNVVYNMFIVKKEAFTFNKLLMIARQDLNYKGSKTTLRRILDELGFKIHKTTPKGVFILIEKSDSDYDSKERDKNHQACKKKKTLKDSCLNSGDPLSTTYNTSQCWAEAYSHNKGVVHDNEEDLTILKKKDSYKVTEEDRDSSTEDIPDKIKETNSEVMEEEFLEEFEDHDLI